MAEAATPTSAFTVRSVRPSPHLRTVVESFGGRRGVFAAFCIVRPLHARPDVFAEFYFRDPYRVGSAEQGFSAAPASVLVGPTTRPGAHLGLDGECENFTIRFTPTGASRLLGLPAHEIVDQATSMKDLLGRRLMPLESHLQRARTFDERIAVAEAFLGRMLDEARPYGAIDHAARLLARSHGRLSLDFIARRAGVSMRQLQRRFLLEVGATPKLYARLHRFSAAIDARQARPDSAWSSIAAAFGYADQAHLAHECRQLADMTPNSLLASLGSVSVSETYNP